VGHVTQMHEERWLFFSQESPFLQENRGHNAWCEIHIETELLRLEVWLKW
jgi:hypothetical protein